MKGEYKRIADALRFCGAAKGPCRCCPYFAEMDPFDCWTLLMVKAAEVIEGMAKEETC